MESLIARIKQRVADPLRAVDAAAWVEPAPSIAPPISAADVNAAESALGFPLPPLIRALYTEVGNGDWGPGYGLLPLTGNGSLVEETLRHIRYKPGWPPRLVRFVEWGCHYASCVDCSALACPVVFYDNDVAIQDGVGPADYLYPEAGSLAGWLSSWLEGVNLWEVSPKAKRGA
jgi:hypothetical protein